MTGADLGPEFPDFLIEGNGVVLGGVSREEEGLALKVKGARHDGTYSGDQAGQPMAVIGASPALAGQGPPVCKRAFTQSSSIYQCSGPSKRLFFVFFAKGAQNRLSASLAVG
jgi:hypothetical protein